MKKTFKKIIVYIITQIARAILWQHKPYIIAITGNLGKTTTKDAVVAGLSNLYVRGNEKSLNSDIGVPLTIIGANNPWYSIHKWLYVIVKGIFVFFARDYPEFLVLEVGADNKGDIKDITKWIKPEITIITQFAEVPVHIENFGDDREALIREKEYLALATSELIIYNGDDLDCQRIAKRATLANDKLIKMSYGKGLHNTLILRDVGNSYDLHSAVGTVEYEHRLYKVNIDGCLGHAAILSAMPAILTSIYISNFNFLESEILNQDDLTDNTQVHVDKIDIVNIITDTIKRLNNIKRQSGRMSPLYGINSSLIIDDTYNASPKAIENGLETLREIGAKYRRIVVLGDMKELGYRSEAEHYRIGRLIPGSANILVTLGEQSKHIARGAREAGLKDGYSIECDNREDIVRELKNIIKQGDIIYVKGSQSMRMEKVVKEILDHSSHVAEEVLTRQDKEWLKM